MSTVSVAFKTLVLTAVKHPNPIARRFRNLTSWYGTNVGCSGKHGGTKQEPSVPDDTVGRFMEIKSSSTNKLLVVAEACITYMVNVWKWFTSYVLVIGDGPDMTLLKGREISRC